MAKQSSKKPGPKPKASRGTAAKADKEPKRKEEKAVLKEESRKEDTVGSVPEKKETVDPVTSQRDESSNVIDDLKMELAEKKENLEELSRIHEEALDNLSEAIEEKIALERKVKALEEEKREQVLTVGTLNRFVEYAQEKIPVMKSHLPVKFVRLMKEEVIPSWERLQGKVSEISEALKR